MIPLYQLVDSLEVDNVTAGVLRALEGLAPLKWENPSGFENMISLVTKETEPSIIFRIRNRVMELYDAPQNGYQRAVWLYQAVDSADKSLGMAAMANSIGTKIGFLSFLNKITPKADKVQAVDFALKLTAESIAFTYLYGFPEGSIDDFVRALATYDNESLLRMFALITLDGVIPFGDTCLDTIGELLTHSVTPKDFEENGLFRRIRDVIPGGDAGQKSNMVIQNFRRVEDWMREMVAVRAITQQTVAEHLGSAIDMTGEKSEKYEFIAGFLDSSTNYFEHLGIQTIARFLIERAATEF